MKTVSQVKKLYSKIDWYKQGAAERITYIGYSWKACLGFTVKGKRIPLNYLPFGVYLRKDDFMDIYFPRSRFREVAEFYYGKEKRKPGFLAALKRSWERVDFLALQKIVKKIEAADLSKLNQRELFKFFDQFSEVNLAFWREAIFLDAFDVAGDLILEKAIQKEGKEIKEQNLQILISPEELSWIQKEKKELSGLADLARHDKKLLKLVARGDSRTLETYFPQFVKKLKTHASRYHWIYNDYAVIHRLDWKFFLGNLRGFLDKKIYERERRAIVSVARAKKEKQKLIKKLKLSRELVQTINFLVVLAAWRDWRKTCTQMASGALSLFVDEFRKRSGLSQKEMNCLWWWEIKNIFKLKKKDRQLIKKRSLGFFVVGDPEKGSFLGKDGAALQLFMTKLLARSEELKGRPAYWGVARGRVKIILSQKDFYKMKKGDIIIAPNTRPEYVPIMKMAGAIVSEEGGLTCHAAIVSRELKVPAVVGVQGAIAVLKDGDLVEVDANKGIVKIIE